MDTVAEQWAKLHRSVYPYGAPPVQMRELRRAFFAGARSMLNLVLEASDLEMEPGSAELEKLDAELNAFGDAITRGEA